MSFTSLEIEPQDIIQKLRSGRGYPNTKLIRGYISTISEVHNTRTLELFLRKIPNV
jgi:hypothetical protein